MKATSPFSAWFCAAQRRALGGTCGVLTIASLACSTRPDAGAHPTEAAPRLPEPKAARTNPSATAVDGKPSSSAVAAASAVAASSAVASAASAVAPGSAVAALAERPPSGPALSPSEAPRPSAPATPPDNAPRVYARTRFVWIHAAPSDAQDWIGFMAFGGSVKLKETTPRFGAGCTTWYAIEPKGFVCVDNIDATLNANDPMLLATRPFAPDLNSPWPHRYAESRDVQKYRVLPTLAEQRKREWDFTTHLELLSSLRLHPEQKRPLLMEGVEFTAASEPAPKFPQLRSTVHEPRERLQHLSTVAYSREFEHEGRSWVLTADLTWVPKDRVAPYPHVRFHGVRLGIDAKLPLAFFRTADRSGWDLSGAAPVEKPGAHPRLSFVELTGQERSVGADKYLETRAGDWVKAAEAVVPKPQELTPWGAPVGGEDKTGKAPGGRNSWLEASVLGGWMLAFEGTKPIYATMIAPGRGGIPYPGKEPISTASTPVGAFHITGKFATATMAAPYDFIHSDVPWTQNFSGPHALHTAYWHDGWGDKKSAGCVNVAPIDGKWLYEFTEPAVPAGWHGVRWDAGKEPSTIFVVHR